MLTRLKVSGFKNLVDVDLRFGPFTCIAGPNGAGKSNLFDAIRFLSTLADKPLMEAALSVRDETGKTTDVRSLFYRHGDQYEPRMSFEAEMIIPGEGTDDLHQIAKATITFLRYSLVLSYRKDKSTASLGSLELVREELGYIKKKSAPRHLLFPHSISNWRRSVVMGRRSGSPFISTTGNDKEPRVIKLHQDGRGGKPLERKAADLPRTVLSSARAAESPTALLARREMQSWQLLQLEPSALRKPDEFSAPTKLGPNGSHLAASLYRLASQEETHKPTDRIRATQASAVYAQIANRLAELIDDVHDLFVDRDERRELLTLYVTGKDKTPHAARALSDGTLRFLALAVLAQDPQAQGVLCLEEPENGIHPERIPAMIRLLQDIATDPTEPVGLDNPLRQVIVNTHSPLVVQQVSEDSLLVAELKESFHENSRVKGACFSCLPNTWRIEKSPNPQSEHICPKGKLLDYLNPVPSAKYHDELQHVPPSRRRRTPRRVVDREDVQPLLFPMPRE
ncbi:MAG: AAA family ATPase [Planctomycetota bacterium]